MYTPVLSMMLVIFIVWFRFKVRASNKVHQESSSKYWQKDRDSNNTRRVDITNLDYISIPLESLPMDDKKDATLNSYRDKIIQLSSEKIINLSGYTNTDLKYKYGVANLSILAEYDKHYSTLVSILQKWGERLYEKGLIQDGKSVLEFAVSCKTEVRATYRLLTKIYIELETPELINHLLQSIPESKMMKADELMDELNQVKLV